MCLYHHAIRVGLGGRVKSGHLWTPRTGRGEVDDLMDHLSMSWFSTTNKTDAEIIEASELRDRFHFPLNIKGNDRLETSDFVQHLKAVRAAYREVCLD